MEIRPLDNQLHAGPGLVGKSHSGGAPVVAAKPAAPPADAAALVQQPVAVPHLEQVKQAVQNINKAMQALTQNLEFSIDEESHHTIVKVVDQQTKEVIRQVPSKEALEIAKALDKIQGLLIRQKA